MASTAPSTRIPCSTSYVFRFDIHIDPVIDGDRCSSSTVDRQRNEMKSITNNSTWAKVQGNWDEWQILEWKFKLPAGIPAHAELLPHPSVQGTGRPEQRQPVITITPRASSSGANKRIQIIHSVDGREHGQGNDRGQHSAVGLRGRMGAGS